jgi:hypothetical protein
MHRATLYNRLLRREPAADRGHVPASNAPQLSPVLEEHPSQLGSAAPSPVVENANANGNGSAAAWLAGLGHQEPAQRRDGEAAAGEQARVVHAEDDGGFAEGGAGDGDEQADDPDEWEEHEVEGDAGADEHERPGRRSRTRRFAKRRVRSPRPSANRPTTYSNAVVPLNDDNDNNNGPPLSPRSRPRVAAPVADEEKEKDGPVPMNIDGDDERQAPAAADADADAAENLASNRAIAQPNDGQQPNANNALEAEFHAQEAAADVEEDWAVYCIRVHDTAEPWRTNISACRYATDDVSANLRHELASLNDTRLSLYPHNELRRHRNTLKCPDANWQFVCVVDGFKTARAAMRFMELSKKACYHNRSRFYSLPDDVQARYGKGGRLLNEQGGPMLGAVRAMTEALWLILHPERNLSIRGGLGRKPADVSAFQGANARLRWVWLEPNLCYAEPMAQLAGPLLHPLQLAEENWSREEGEAADAAQ